MAFNEQENGGVAGSEADPVGLPGLQLQWQQGKPSIHPELLRKSKTEDGQWSRSESRIWMAALLVGTCLLYCARVAMPICAVAMAKEFDWNKKQSGIALGSFFWGYCFTQVLGGYISDRVGGEKVLLLSSVAWGSVTALTPLIAQLSLAPLWLLTLSRFLMGLLQGVHFPSLASLISQKVHESQRSFVSSVVGTGSQVGALLIGSVGSVLLDWCGWESVFFFSGLLALLWGYCMGRFLLKQKGHVVFLETLGARLYHSRCTKVPWKQLFQKASVWAVVVSHFCMCSTFFTLLSWLPTFFKDTFPDSKGWVFNVIPWLTAIPMSVFSGYLADHLIGLGYNTASVRKFMQVNAMGLSSVCALFLSRTTNYVGAIVFASGAVGLQTFHNSGVSVNVQDLAPSCAGSLYGVMNTGGAFLGVCLVYLSGYLIEVTVSWTSVFHLIALVNVLGLSVFLMFGQAQRVDIDTSNAKQQNTSI
ncbi:solute carrier family 17 member 9b [Latimeria chalumnae]|uniref:solute carrier family 17 member 9b n=1 Tax=Latimeria chalumnae TaxID=7897 RepID=UPI00313D2CB0